MARIDCYSSKSFYFCGVKSHSRHDVAAESSFFRASNLVEELYPDECGSSNAHKVFGFENLTARREFLCQIQTI